MNRKSLSVLIIAIFSIALFAQACGNTGDDGPIPINPTDTTTSGDTFGAFCPSGNYDADGLCNDEEGDIDGDGEINLDLGETSPNDIDSDGDGVEDEISGFSKFMKSDFMTGVYIVGGIAASVWGIKKYKGWRDKTTLEVKGLENADGTFDISLNGMKALGLEPGEFIAKQVAKATKNTPLSKDGRLWKYQTARVYDQIKDGTGKRRNNQNVISVTLVVQYIKDGVEVKIGKDGKAHKETVQLVKKVADLDNTARLPYNMRCSDRDDGTGSSTPVALLAEKYKDLGDHTGVWVQVERKDGKYRCQRFDEKDWGFIPITGEPYSWTSQALGYNAENETFFYISKGDPTEEAEVTEANTSTVLLIPDLSQTNATVKSALEKDLNAVKAALDAGTISLEEANKLYLAVFEKHNIPIIGKEGTGSEETIKIKLSDDDYDKTADQHVQMCTSYSPHHEAFNSKERAQSICMECTTWMVNNVGSITSETYDDKCTWHTVQRSAELHLQSHLKTWCRTTNGKSVDQDPNIGKGICAEVLAAAILSP